MNDTREPAPDRLEFVDCLRGFALFGVFWANLPIFAGLTYMTDTQRVALFGGRLDGVAHFVMRFLIEDKFVGLFSLLFGVSFWLFLGAARRRGGSATALFYRRIFWLLVIGAIHGWLFWCFDILRFYALWALLLPLCARMAPRTLLGTALIAGLLVPTLVTGANVAWTRPVADATDYDAMALAAFSRGTYLEFLAANWRYDWHLTLELSQVGYQVAVFGRLLLGLYLVQTLDLGNLEVHRDLLRRGLVWGGLAGVVGNVIFAGHLFAGAAASAGPAMGRKLLMESGKLGMTLAYASALALAFLTPRWTGAVRRLAPMGKMALTWYLLQTAFGIGLFYGFARGPALMGKVGPASLAAVALVGYGVQVALARWWVRRFRFGPAEWCWRSLTYWRVQPMAALPIDDPR